MQLQIVKTIGSFVRNVNKTYLLSLCVHVFWSIFNRKLTVEFVLIVVHNRYHHRWSYMLSMVDRCFFCFLYLDSIYFCKILRMHRFSTLVVLRWHCLDGAKKNNKNRNKNNKVKSKFSNSNFNQFIIYFILIDVFCFVLFFVEVFSRCLQEMGKKSRRDDRIAYKLIILCDINKRFLLN